MIGLGVYLLYARMKNGGPRPPGIPGNYLGRQAMTGSVVEAIRGPLLLIALGAIPGPPTSWITWI